MRLACVALVFSLLLSQEDPNGAPPLLHRLCREQNGLRRLQGTFGWQPPSADSWVPESSWLSWLAGLGMVLVCALLDSWVTSCLASLQRPPAPSAALSETETAKEMDLETPQRECSLCLSGQPSTSGFQSYDQPSERHRHSLEAFEGTGKRRRGEVLYPEHKKRRSSLSSPQHSLQDLSSSPSYFCLSHLKNLDFCCAPGAFSSAECSEETVGVWARGATSSSSGSESESSGSYRTSQDPSLPEEEGCCLRDEGTPEPPPPPAQASLLLLETCSETTSVCLSLQAREVQTQTSVARINIVQSSAYEKDGRLCLVEKSLQVQMGALRRPKAQPSLPKLTHNDEKEKKRQPPPVALVALKSLPHTDKNRTCKHVSSLCRLLDTLGKAIPKSSSQSRECSGLNAIFISASPDEFVPSVLDQDTRDFLEFHIKKKMVQWKCGMPSVVAKSVAAFQSLTSLWSGPASDSHTPTGTITLVSRKRVALTLLFPPLVFVGTFSSEQALGLKSTFTLSSWKPEDLHRLAFHTAAKALEIKMGAFPEMVGHSFQLFRGASEKSLPKMINSGNKILKPKYPLLPFLAQENICILDLNIKRKCLAYSGNVSITYTKLTATVTTSSSSRPRESEEETREQMARFLVSLWGQIHRAGISSCGLNQRLPLPQLLDSSTSSASPPIGAEESIQVLFQSAPLKEPAALQVSADAPRPLEELAKGYEESRQWKPLAGGPGQRALPPPPVPPDPKSSVVSRRAMKLRAEASIIRTSIFLELEVKKEKLNLHLRKKVRAQLQPPQGAGLEITIQPRRRARTSQASSSPRPLGKPRRSFCYVCMPSNDASAKLKTVCWSLPRWILEMNGYRTPEVARLASKSRTPQPAQK